jgi:hypothetical protein
LNSGGSVGRQIETGRLDGENFQRWIKDDRIILAT